MLRELKFNLKQKKVCAFVCNIPKGKVSTYGNVARFAGFPRCARMVSAALRSAPESLHVPWHRVINAQGRISFPTGSEKAVTQLLRLQEEGVAFISGSVDLGRYAWAGNLDQDLWQM